MSEITVGYKITCSELQPVTYIEPTWCIGNSLEYINNNFTIVETNVSEVCESLNSTITAVESFKSVPIGTIVMWSGIIVDVNNNELEAYEIVNDTEAYIQVDGQINQNWAVCTGKAYDSVPTPDLIGRFIVGAGTTPKNDEFNDPDTLLYNVGDFGGSELHDLTITEIPSHNHTFTASSSGSSVSLLKDTTSVSITTQTYAAGSRKLPNNVTGVTLEKDAIPASALAPSYNMQNTGGGQSHENRPPYYALYYIMRIT